MKRIALTVVLMLAALLVLGVGFARWFDVLTIDGEVNTGEVIAELTTDRPEVIVGDDKDVSTMTRELVDTDADGYNDQMLFTIDDAYPGVTYRATFEVNCVGDIPIHVKPYFNPADSNWDPAWGIWGIGYYGGGTPSPDGPFQGWVQLHQGETAEYHVRLTFDNDLPEGETPTVAMDIDCGQYNEANVDPTP